MSCFSCNGKGAGQNVYVTFTEGDEIPMDRVKIVESWYDEIKDYDYDTNKCDSMCGHYTQAGFKVFVLNRILGKSFSSSCVRFTLADLLTNT